MLATLKRLRDLGNSLIVVEHDEDTMFAADCIVDIGPGAGEHGGQVVAIGTAKELMKCKILSLEISEWEKENPCSNRKKKASRIFEGRWCTGK